jgi:hypothetical protein
VWSNYFTGLSAYTHRNAPQSQRDAARDIAPLPDVNSRWRCYHELLPSIPTSFDWTGDYPARKYYQARFVKTLIPMVEDRIRMWEAGKADVPDDFLQWMIPILAKRVMSKLTLPG